MDILLLVVVIVLIGVVIFQSVRINKIALSKNEDQSVNLLKMDVIELNKSLIKMRENLDVNLNNFNEKVSEKLERNNFQLQNSMAKQISESSKIVEEVSKRLTKLDETNNRVVNVAEIGRASCRERVCLYV